MRRITVQNRQCLLDIAIQECGDIAAIVQIARLNGIGITDSIDVGTVLRIPTPINAKIVAIYKNKKIIPATEIE